MPDPYPITIEAHLIAGADRIFTRSPHSDHWREITPAGTARFFIRWSLIDHWREISETEARASLQTLPVHINTAAARLLGVAPGNHDPRPLPATPEPT